MWDVESSGSESNDKELHLPLQPDPPRRRESHGTLSRRPSIVEPSILNMPSTADFSPKKRPRTFGFEEERVSSSPAVPLKGHEAVRANLRRQHTARYMQLSALALRGNRKLQVAQNRRLLMESSREEKIVSAWFSLMASFTFAYRLDYRRDVQKSIAFFIQRFAPCVRLITLRKRYQKLVQSESAKIVPPPLELDTLMSDALLQKFGAVHLRTVLPTAEFRFFLAGRSLFYQGEEGTDECYAIVGGEVEIRIRKHGDKKEAVVATLGPGSVVGTIGMLIAGEKRMARVRCKTNVQTYVIRRTAFMSAVVDKSVMLNAITEVSRLHEANIPAIYADMTMAEALAKYHLFSNIDLLVLNSIRSLMKPKVFRPGEVVVDAGSRPSKMIFILQGIVELHRESRCEFPTQTPLEVFANMADISAASTKLTRKEYFSQNHANNAHGNIVGALEPKTVIGGPMFLIMEPYQLTAVARTSVDAMVTDITQFLSLMISMPIALGQLRRNACRAMSDWLRPISRATLHQSIFSEGGAMALQFLRATRQIDFEIKPTVVNQGDQLIFGRESSVAYIVTSGKLEGLPERLPVMWPSVSILFFGNFVTSTRVLQRTEAWCLTRKSFIAVLKKLLDDEKMNTFFTEMYSLFENATGKYPSFEEGPDIPAVNNPMLEKPPAPPPERKPRSARKTRPQVSETTAPSKTKNSSVKALEIDEDDDALDSAHSNRRSRTPSVTLLIQDPRTSDESDGVEGPEASYRPIFPPVKSTVTSMKRAMRSALLQQRQATLKLSNKQSMQLRSTSLPAIASKEIASEDPYTKIFGDSEMTDVFRGPRHASTSARSHRRAPLISTGTPIAASTIARHSISLSELRRTKHGDHST